MRRALVSVARKWKVPSRRTRCALGCPGTVRKSSRMAHFAIRGIIVQGRVPTVIGQKCSRLTLQAVRSGGVLQKFACWANEARTGSEVYTVAIGFTCVRVRRVHSTGTVDAVVDRIMGFHSNKVYIDVHGCGRIRNDLPTFMGQMFPCWTEAARLLTLICSISSGRAYDAM